MTTKRRGKNTPGKTPRNLEKRLMCSSKRSVAAQKHTFTLPPKIKYGKYPVE